MLPHWWVPQFLAPVGALLFSSINPMTDNASVSLYSVGPAAAADTIQQRSSSSSRKASTTGRNGLELLAITEDQWGSYLVDPATLKTIKQVRCCLVASSVHQGIKQVTQPASPLCAPCWADMHAMLHAVYLCGVWSC